MTVINLNHVAIKTDGHDRQQEKLSITRACRVSVHFYDLEDLLIEQIEQYPVVVGCVAWLTNRRILRALGTRRRVHIVVQKEDFLRPDLSTKKGWTKELRGLYAALGNHGDRFAMGGLLGNMSTCCDPTIEGVRCVGNHNSDKSPAFPRMHNKFLVFCDYQVVDENDPDYLGWDVALIPRMVWTGSFNLTENATMSFENAVIIDDPKVADIFYQEWEQIMALSEPLDWRKPWMEPQWRVGT